jgi:hypothetical protein
VLPPIRVDAGKARLDAARPLPPYTVASLREKLHLEWTYHSLKRMENKCKSKRLWPNSRPHCAMPKP